MNDREKQRLKLFGFSLILTAVFFIASTIRNDNQWLDSHGVQAYIWPNIWPASAQREVWNALLLILPYLAILIGLVLVLFFIHVYCIVWQSTLKRAKSLGFAKMSDYSWSIKRYITRFIIVILLGLNFFIIFLSFDVAYWTTGDIPPFHSGTGAPYNYTVFPWMVLSTCCAFLIVVPCWILLDSGLVSSLEIKEHINFNDTERVGNFFYSIIKGYAGISVFINWIALIYSPIGGEGSIALLPVFIIVILLPPTILLDVLRSRIKGFIAKTVKIYAKELKILEIDLKESKVSYEDLN